MKKAGFLDAFFDVSSGAASIASTTEIVGTASSAALDSVATAGTVTIAGGLVKLLGSLHSDEKPSKETLQQYLTEAGRDLAKRGREAGWDWSKLDRQLWLDARHRLEPCFPTVADLAAGQLNPTAIADEAIEKIKASGDESVSALLDGDGAEDAVRAVIVKTVKIIDDRQTFYEALNTQLHIKTQDGVAELKDTAKGIEYKQETIIESQRQQTEFQRQQAEFQRQTMETMEALLQNATQNADIKDREKLLAQIEELFKSNDVEARDAIEKGIPGDGLDDLDELNAARLRDVREHQSLLELEAKGAARSHRAAGAAHQLQGRVGKAITAYEGARELDPDDFWTRVFLRRLYSQAGRTEAAFETANTLQDIARTPRERSVALEEIGNVQSQQGELARALIAYQESLAIFQTLATDKTNAQAQRDLSVSLEKISDVHGQQGDLPGALKSYKESHSIRRTLATDTTNAQAQRDLVVSLAKIGLAHRADGDEGAARAAFEEALSIAMPLAARAPDMVRYQELVAWLKNQLAD